MKKSINRNHLKTSAIAAAVYLVLIPTSSMAALVNFATKPLYISTAVAPNLSVLLDDSGSMAWGYAPDSISNTTSTRRFRSSYFNPIAYNPDITYTAPINEVGTAYTTSFTKAWLNGFDQSRGSVNLSNNYRVTVDYDPSQNSQTLASNPTGSGNFSNSNSGYAATYYVRDNALSGCTASNINDEDCYKKITVSTTSGKKVKDEVCSICGA